MALLDGGTSSSLVQVGPTPNGRPPRRAIALKLSEETLAQLMALASRGRQPDKGTLQIDLGSNPMFMFNGASYPVTLLEEAPHTELLCYTRAKSGSSATISASTPTAKPRQLERFADVSHKATLKPSTNLDRVSQALREQRSVAEKEKQGKRAVLIESAPTSRSNSKNRHPTASTSAVSMPLHPVASTSTSSSTTTSPAVRPPSRLIAVAQRATPAQVAAAAAKRSPPEQQYVSLAAVSPPSTVLPTTTTHPSPPYAVSPARQHSSASSESSITSASSLLQHSTASTSTSTSTGTGTSAQKGRASLSSVESPAASTEPPIASTSSKPVAAGGGGVLKGKDSLKKEKEKRQRRKNEVAEAVRIASKPRHDQNEPLPFSPLLMQGGEEDEDDEDEDAEGEVDEEMASVAQEEPRSLLKKKRRMTIAGDELGSDASTTKGSRSRVATPTPSSSNPSTTTKKRKRALAKSERWYSSSSESEGEASQAAPTSASKAAAGTSSDVASNRSKGLSIPPPTKNGSLVKRRRTVSSNDLALPIAADSDPERGRQNSVAASLSAPSRASSTSNHKTQPVRSSSLSQVVGTSTSTAIDSSDRFPSLSGTNDASDCYVTITSSASFERHRQLFEEAYPSYRALYDTLMQERQILASKDGARPSQGRYTLDEVRKLVKRLEMNRDELERIKLGLKKYAMTAGIPLVLNSGTTR